MVKGVQLFREHFKPFSNAFVVIGGVACDEWLTSQGLKFRATKDVDIVLIIEALTPAFVAHFWDFIKKADYDANYRVGGQGVYYRFVKPHDDAYPAMIELFSRQPDGIDLAAGQEIVPIGADEDVSSLSAILMDDAYYELIRDHRDQAQGLPTIQPIALIPLKARAWIDLSKRQQEGQKVDSRDLKKHRNDVFRLAATLPDEPGPELVESLRQDLKIFLAHLPADASDWKAIGDSLEGSLGPATPSSADLLGALNKYFRLG